MKNCDPCERMTASEIVAGFMHKKERDGFTSIRPIIDRVLCIIARHQTAKSQDPTVTHRLHLLLAIQRARDAGFGHLADALTELLRKHFNS